MRSRVVSGPASLALLLVVAPAPLAWSRDLPRGAQRIHFPSDAFSPPQPQVTHLSYYGGPVVSNVVVVQVLWGSCDATVTSSLPTFYTDIVDSPYVDWLCEYNSNVTSYMGGSSSQAIGRGTFGGQVTITPSITSSSITLDQIGSELAAQIDSMVLPAPALDAGGNVNTVYMFHIPSGITVSYSGGTSCVDFCGIHFTKVHNGLSIPFGVIPYQLALGCNGGCGLGTYLANVESVSSHELVESITDAAVGLANLSGPLGPPIAWIDATNGEIGDICNGQTATIMVNGHSHTVQKEWSNRANACIATSSSTCPCVSSAPQPTTSCLGGTATFDVVASGTVLTYQWRKNGTNLVDDGVHVVGAQTPSVTIANLVAGDAASYDVVVGGGACGNLTTTAAALTLSPDAAPPDIVPPAAAIVSQTVCQ